MGHRHYYLPKVGWIFPEEGFDKGLCCRYPFLQQPEADRDDLLEILSLNHFIKTIQGKE